MLNLKEPGKCFSIISEKMGTLSNFLVASLLFIGCAGKIGLRPQKGLAGDFLLNESKHEVLYRLGLSTDYSDTLRDIQASLAGIPGNWSLDFVDSKVAWAEFNTLPQFSDSLEKVLIRFFGQPTYADPSKSTFIGRVHIWTSNDYFMLFDGSTEKAPLPVRYLKNFDERRDRDILKNES